MNWQDEQKKVATGVTGGQQPVAQLKQEQEPDWSKSENCQEMWQNRLITMSDRLLIADGAISFERKVNANLRKKLAELESKLAEAEKQSDSVEPVAWAWYYQIDGSKGISFSPDKYSSKPWQPLYTHPQPKQEHGEPEENRFVRELREYGKTNQGAYLFPSWDIHRALKYLDGYNHPQPKREWVGLTDEDDIDWDVTGNLKQLVEAVEAKLKEKNT